MKLKCPISGVAWTVAQPLAGEGKAVHPMLSPCLSANYLSETYLPIWATGNMSLAEAHLLAMAFLLKLPLESTPELQVAHTHRLASTFTQSMQLLAKLAIKCETFSALKSLPKFRFNPNEPATLKSYLETLDGAIKVATASITPEARQANRLARLLTTTDVDSILHRGLRGSPLTKRDRGTFQRGLLQFIERIKPFPTATILRKDGRKIPQCQVWRDLLTTIFEEAGIYAIIGAGFTIDETEDLRDWLYDNIPNDTTHASAIFKAVNEALDLLEEFYGHTYQRKNAATAATALLLEDVPERPTKSATEIAASLRNALAARLKKN